MNNLVMKVLVFHGFELELLVYHCFLCVLKSFSGGDFNNFWDHQLNRVISRKFERLKKLISCFWFITFKRTKVYFLQVGHSIGSYISVEMFKRSPAKVTKTLYKFCLLLIFHTDSHKGLWLGNLFPDMVYGIVGEILYRTISVSGVEPTIQKAGSYWEACSVKFFVCYEWKYFGFFHIC